MFSSLLPRHFVPLTLGLTCFITGCVQFHPKPLSAERGTAALTERSLNDPGLRDLLHAQRRKVGGAWGFDQFVVAALYFNPELSESRSKLAVAVARKITVGERAKPDDFIRARGCNPY